MALQSGIRHILYLKEAALKALRVLMQEVMLANFYIYGHWTLLAALVEEIIQTFTIIAQTARGHQLQWPYTITPLIFVIPFNVLTIFSICFFKIWDPEAAPYKLESSVWIAFWLLLAIPHWVGLGLQLPYLPQSITLGLAVICYSIAFLLCQSPRATKLIGARGIEQMMLVVPERNFWI
ncbi:hypothetical protein HD806DRAFT_489134 [Xylariaceae sp. AK1471]|nr:hypothetical protein HD806DRAFT_489134 [Xylariaceae sp. AK1471]